MRPDRSTTCTFTYLYTDISVADLASGIIHETVDRTEEPGKPTEPEDVGYDQIEREPQQPARPSQDLPRTGADVARLALIGMLLTAAGIVIARRWRVERS